MENERAYNLSVEDSLNNFNTTKDGLTSEEARKRLAEDGPNQLKEEDKTSLLQKLWAQFADFMVIILIFASIISFIAGEKTDAIVILAIIIINAFLGVYQEGKAEKSLESLKQITSPEAKVYRDGQIKIIDASEIVKGDIINVEAGDIIPADVRWIYSSNLQVEESSLTGESVPVDKDAREMLEGEVSLGDRINSGYMGTIVTYGNAIGLVTATGHLTEIGQIATMLKSYEDDQTPLQKQLNEMGKFIGIGTLVICALIFGLGLLQGEELLDMLLISISLAVAAVPEGLPAIVTIVLSIGMNRMVEKNAIVKKLLAVETLGAITYICSDKTGTLTENQMTVKKLYVDGKIIDVTGTGYEPKGELLLDEKPITTGEIGDLETLLVGSVLANDALLDKNEEGYSIIGDPTEGALITLGEKANYPKKELNENYPRIEEIPFDSDRKMMTTVHSNYVEGEYISFTKGAPDIVIDRCKYISQDGKVLEFTEERKAQVLEANSGFSRLALRVLAVAYKLNEEIPEIDESLEEDLVFVGLIAMMDPARKEAKVAIEECKNAGIIPVMITGDYKETAFQIAKELKIAEDISQVMEGKELDNISDKELKNIVEKVRVYARVSPKHKVRIVDALKTNGEVVAMTGDGVNDAPALKRADIGVAMGITGTDVAKDTSELILTDDNFSTIVGAVEEGRIIYSNIKKFVYFLLSCNLGEVLMVFLAMMLKMPVPLIPIQLLWTNLVTDSFTALALGVEKGDPDIMDEKPRDPKASIIDKPMIIKIAIQGILIAGVTLFAFNYGLQKYPLEGDLYKARTFAFVTLINAELLRAYSSRSDHASLLEIGLFSNKELVMATALGFGLLLVVVYVPFLEPIFHTFDLSLSEFLFTLRLAIIPPIVGEIMKFFTRRRLRNKKVN